MLRTMGIIVAANVYAESQSTEEKRAIVLAHDFAIFAEKPALSLIFNFDEGLEEP